MAREHPSFPKTSSSQKNDQKFDSESDDDDEVKTNKQSQVSKKQSSRDASKLFMKKVDGREERIKFYIIDDDDIEFELLDGLHNQIVDYGGTLVDERPDIGYTLVDPRTEGGELEISSRSTKTRHVVSLLFIEESIKRRSLVPLLELALFIKEDRPVKFHLHNSLPEKEAEQLRDAILLRGGNPDAELSETQVVIHSKDFRDKLIVNRRWRQIELFETSDWLKSCISAKRFAITGAGGRLSVRPAPQPIPDVQPGRKPGAPRTEFTEHDDACLVAWMAYQFGKNQAGRQGNRPYKLLVQDPDHFWWTRRHTWHSWRERYKNKKARLDPLIIQAVNEREQKRSPDRRELQIPEFPDTDNEDSEEQEDVAQEPGPSAVKPRSRTVKRKIQDTSDEMDEQAEPEPVKPTNKGAKRVKVGSQPERATGIKISASQKAREAPRLRSASPPPRVSSNAPPSPDPVPPPASAKPVRKRTPVHEETPTREETPAREETPTGGQSPATQSEMSQDQEDSQSSTQFGNGILDPAVLGGAGGALERHDAELRAVADGTQESEENYSFDDPDVDVVGITQIDSEPSIHFDASRSETDESKTASTGESNQEEETGETVLDTVEERLSAMADGYGAVLSRVGAYYERAIGEGMGEAAALEFTERQLRADFRQEKGKGRAS